MSLTKITTTLIADNAITTDKISNTVTLGGPKIANVQYADASFTVLDDTAANTSGTARLVINGDGFNSGAIVIVGTTQATSTTRVSATQLRANVTAQAAGSYPIYVQNTDGGTAIRVGGVTFSNTPIWGTAATLSNQAANTAFAVSISANSDSNVTYSNTTALPAGTSLLSNGYFYGTVTIGSETTYTFDVKANDAENQDNTRTFSLTVTVGPPAGSLWAWGLDGFSNYFLPLDSAGSRSSPTQVGSGTDWQEVFGGFNGGLAVKSNGSLWVWGNNENGKLGLNDTIIRSSPVQVGSGTNWSKAIPGRTHIIAIKTGGTLWSWGRNVLGELGLNDTVYKSSPVQVGSGTNWSKITLGYGDTSAIKTDGTLWTWGSNGFGQLGINLAGGHRSSPTQVGTDTNWSNVVMSVNQNSPLALKTNGTLWAWGRNSSDASYLGLNNSIDKSSPTQVGTDTNWSEIYFRGGVITFASKTNGTLWGWGDNTAGSLGLNDFVPRSSPTQIGNANDWSKASAGDQHGMFLKSNGTLWLTGRGTYGKLGLNTAGDPESRSSPVQVGTSTNWVNIGAGVYQSYALRS